MPQWYAVRIDRVDPMADSKRLRSTRLPCRRFTQRAQSKKGRGQQRWQQPVQDETLSAPACELGCLPSPSYSEA